MDREKILEEYKSLFPEVNIKSIEKGIDVKGWYSNERNDRWLVIQGREKLLDFSEDRMEFRPKTVSDLEERDMDKLPEQIPTDEMEVEIKKLAPIIRPRGFYDCPNCGKFSGEMPIVREVSMFKDYPDPCYEWREIHKCRKCATVYLIYNGT
jgi:hypothetical protein